MVGKSARKREYSESPIMNEADTGGLVSNGKRLRLTPEGGVEEISPSPGSDKGDHEIDLMLDSGSDCVPMESSCHPLEEEEDDEPYIDVVSEDSAIQEEEMLEEDYGMEDGYHHISHISHMDNLISSHDDSAIIKSEIFDPAYDEMHQMLVSSASDYEQTFLNGVEVSGLLDLKADSEMSLTQEELSMSLKDGVMMEHPPAEVLLPPEDMSSNTTMTTTNNTNTIEGVSNAISAASALTTANGVSIQASLVNAPGILPTLPQPLVNINNLNAASVLGSNAPVLTTPVFLAQGAAGQTNSIITTHLARLVPSPDGKGYILHLGLNPSAAAPAATLPPSTSTTTVSSLGAVSNNTAVQLPLPPAVLPISGGSAIPKYSQTTSSTMSAGSNVVGGPPIKSIASTHHPLVSPLSQTNLNITITPANSTTALLQKPSPTSQEQGESSSSSSGSLNSSPDMGSPVGLSSQVSPMQVVETKNGSESPPIEDTGNVSVCVSSSDPGCVTTVTTPVVNASVSSLSLEGTIGLNGNATAIEMSASAALDNSRQLLEQHLAAQQAPVQLIQQQQPQQSSRSKSKRRNSKELRELMELEQIASKPGGDTDRFVICSDGPMNCALCGFNTSNYSSFKSHIICSHPCWRITKKLSRNRLLVEKSVKVSVPVANFSVPNPVPAVPIQQRVQSKKNRKESAVSGKESKEKATKNDNDCSRKEDPLGGGGGNKGSSKRKEVTCNFLNDIPPLDSSSSCSSSNTRDMQAIEGKRRIYKCTRCLKLFVSEEMTVNHIVDTHNVKKPYTCIEVSNDYGKSFTTIYRCPQKNCTFSCESISSLERHKNEVHTQQAVYRCQICGYSADSTKAVNEHAVKIHRQQVMMYGLAD